MINKANYGNNIINNKLLLKIQVESELIPTTVVTANTNLENGRINRIQLIVNNNAQNTIKSAIVQWTYRGWVKITKIALFQ